MTKQMVLADTETGEFGGQVQEQLLSTIAEVGDVRYAGTAAVEPVRRAASARAFDAAAYVRRPRRVITIPASGVVSVTFRLQQGAGQFATSPLYRLGVTARRNTAGTFCAAELPFFLGNNSTPSLRIGSLVNIVGTQFATTGGDVTVGLAIDAAGAVLTATFTNNLMEIVRLSASLDGHDPVRSASAYACWGDSLTQGNASPFPNTLSSLSGVPAYNLGIGGDTTEMIAARAMALPTYLTAPLSIPASGGVAVSMSPSSLSVAFPATQAMIAGVQGVLTVANGVKTFTRAVAGPPVVAPTGTPVLYTDAPLMNELIAVVWAGTNDGYTYTNAVDNVARIIDANRTGKVIVVGPLISADYGAGTTQHNAFDAAIARYEAAFGATFIDIQKYLHTDGLADAGITPTAQDNADIANRVTPTSLRQSGDKVHLSTTGYPLVAQKVWQKAQALGYTY